METCSLVILKGQTPLVIEGSGTTFLPNKHYRCVKYGNEFIVYGEPFTKGLFNNMFEPLHDRMLCEFNDIGLMDNMKPITKKSFKERARLTTYTSRGSRLEVFFFGDKMRGMVGFYPLYNKDSKAVCLNLAYKNYQDILNGNLDSVDNDLVQRGNGGVPLQYQDLYFKKPYIEKSII